MLLTLEQFHHHARVVADLPQAAPVGFDKETNGLQVRRGHKAFILGFAYADQTHSVLTDDSRFAEVYRLFLSNVRARYCAHNAKSVEMAFARHQFQAEVMGDIWDTEVMARLEYNDHLTYSLDACAKRIGLSKYQPAVDWMDKNDKLHHEMPLELCIPYVEQDALLELPLYEHQRSVFNEWNRSSAVPMDKLVRLEMATTKNLFEMEDAGLNVDVSYCHEADEYELKRSEAAKSAFTSATGVKFVDSGKTFKPIFDAHGIPYGKTKKGAPSFAIDVIERSREHPIVKPIVDYRTAKKRSSTYWQGIIERHNNGIITPNIRQPGAATGRFSTSDPNVQNWPDDSEDPSCLYPIRRAFKADPGCKILSIDYAQMELRKMCDEAGDLKMADAFRAGYDFHQEVANDAQVKRSLAKNGRFAKLYGAGVPRVASTLGITLEQAATLCAALDRASPEISAYCRNLMKYAEQAPFGYNWLGRRYFFARNTAYKYPNYRIQGGCADILRIAICDVRALLKAEAKGNTKLLIPIHDELTFKIEPCDFRLIPEIKRLMIAAQRDKRYLEMDVSVSIGDNFHDLEDWVA